MNEYKYLENPIPKHIVEQIRANVIEEFISLCKTKINDNCIEFEDDYLALDISEIMEIAENLKSVK